MRAIRVLFTATLATLVTVGWASTCWACSCVQATQHEHFARAEVVFTGTLVGRRAGPTPPPGNAYAYGAVTHTFEVESVQKGRAASRQGIVTEGDEASCGYAFADGGRYQVFAYRDGDGELRTNICTGTRALDAGEEPFAPEGSSTPAPRTPPPPTPPATPRATPEGPRSTPVQVSPVAATPDATPQGTPLAAPPPDGGGTARGAVAGAVAVGGITLAGAGAIAARRLRAR